MHALTYIITIYVGIKFKRTFIVLISTYVIIKSIYLYAMNRLKRFVL